MRRLSGMDAAFLYAETPAMHMHGGALTILDPSTAPQRLDVHRFREIIAARLDQLAPFRQRLITTPFGIDRPVWVDDQHVDVRAHIRPIAVPRPGTARQVADLAGELLAVPLPRDRPLWEMWFIEGLEHGHAGLLTKVHHALLGGTQATAMFELIFDLDAGPAARTPEPGEPEQEMSEHPPSPFTAAGHAALALAGTPLRAARATGDVALAAARLTRFFTSGDRAATVLPWQGPATSLNGSVIAARACAYCSMSLAEVRAVKRAHGVTVNDVVLAVCGGALRHYLTERGELSDKPLTAVIPVSVSAPRGDGAASVMGNTVSVFGATLATDLADPLQRLRRISASTLAAKRLHQALGPQTIMHLADVLPPGLFGAAIHGYAATRLASRMAPPFNLVISNVPGPSMTLYSGGARVLADHIFGPIVEGVSLNITVLSYQNSIDVGIVASPDLAPDPWRIADAMPAALAELSAATAVPGTAGSDRLRA